MTYPALTTTIIHMKNKYHIDVTPEEDMLFRPAPLVNKTEFKIAFKQIFGVILLLHVFVVGGIVFFGGTSSTAASTQQTVKQEPPQPEQPKSGAEPIVQPPVVQQNKPTELAPPPNSTVVQKLSVYTKSYKVKKGDTLKSIVKKFKLNEKTLIKINKITDPNKIVEGQVLKFTNH